MRFPISKSLRIVISALILAGVALAADSGYHLLNTYKFPAAPGATGEYFDYVTVDAAARRVYLSRGTAVQVIDADSGKDLGYIPGFQRQHGVAIAPEFDHGFISDGGAGKITVFDLKTLKAIKDVKADPDTDCMVYDPVSKQAFSMNGDGNSTTVVNAETGDLVKSVPLGGAPEFAVADGKGMIYANLADKNVIAAIDTKTLEVKSRWPVAPEGEPTALAIDREHRRLFSAGRNPQILAILDADSGKVIQTFPISAGTDAAAYDPATGMIYVSTIEGNIHIFHEDTPDKYSMVDTVKTEYGAKTMGLDTKTHQLYLDTADFSAPPAQPPAGGRGGRRAPIPGTYRVLVYGK
jgi:DNA-binding beta-propeller fold protein YncE